MKNFIYFCLLICSLFAEVENRPLEKDSFVYVSVGGSQWLNLKPTHLLGDVALGWRTMGKRFATDCNVGVQPFYHRQKAGCTGWYVQCNEFYYPFERGLYLGVGAQLFLMERYPLIPGDVPLTFGYQFPSCSFIEIQAFPLTSFWASFFGMVAGGNPVVYSSLKCGYGF